MQSAIAEYEQRAARYWNLETIEVKEERAVRGLPEEQIRAKESERLLKRVPNGADVFALTRTGDAFSSDRFARYLSELARHGSADAVFLIGGALGLHDAVLRSADRRIRLSTFTLPHDMARLLLMEQLYRAGTIVRGEPYHKGGD